MSHWVACTVGMSVMAAGAEPVVAPFGAWESPITADLIVGDTVALSAPRVDGDYIYWIESRPSEEGRSVIVRRTPDGTIEDMTPAGFNVRTRVHEYGGGEFIVHEETVYFVNFADQRVYRQKPGEDPAPITPEGPWRYADFDVVADGRALICVREDHGVAGPEPINTLVLLPTDRVTEGYVQVQGHDFYAAPRVSPDGRYLVWLAWEHPNMPWDATELWVGRFEVHSPADAARPAILEARQLASGPNESLFQPEWGPDGTLHFVSDRTGWWNLYRIHDGKAGPLQRMAAEFGAPMWTFAKRTYAFAGETLVCAYQRNGVDVLARYDAKTQGFVPFNLPYTAIFDLAANREHVYALAASPSTQTELVRIHVESGSIDIMKRSSRVSVESEYISVPEAIEFPTNDGETAHAFFYPPANPRFAGPPESKPPLLVISHGGPTGATDSALDLRIQYWTSRGFAVVDVNYRGSTGYGRAYRDRLKGQWGILDVTDCVNAAKFLVDCGRVDADRIAIRGGSAGGYTTLAALTFTDMFKAGASYFGVSDLEALTQETHKFESRYLDSLVGPYPERKDLYETRSPIHFTDKLSCPVIFFQGLDDKVVPPNQAERMVEALRRKGIAVAYVAFEGEGHGFRKAENIKQALENELDFYGRVFGFIPAGPIAPVEIANLPQ